MTTQTIRETVDGLKSLGHPARLRILTLLRGSELCVCQVTEVLGLAPSTVSEHLSLLRRSGFIEERKAGKWVFYGLTHDPERLAICEAVWAILAGDDTLAKDAVRCSAVRGMPLQAVCKTGGSPLRQATISVRG